MVGLAGVLVVRQATIAAQVGCWWEGLGVWVDGVLGEGGVVAEFAVEAVGAGVVVEDVEADGVCAVGGGEVVGVVEGGGAVAVALVGFVDADVVEVGPGLVGVEVDVADVLVFIGDVVESVAGGVLAVGEECGDVGVCGVVGGVGVGASGDEVGGVAGGEPGDVGGVFGGGFGGEGEWAGVVPWGEGEVHVVGFGCCARCGECGVPRGGFSRGDDPNTDA